MSEDAVPEAVFDAVLDPVAVLETVTPNPLVEAADTVSVEELTELISVRGPEAHVTINLPGAGGRVGARGRSRS